MRPAPTPSAPRRAAGLAALLPLLGALVLAACSGTPPAPADPTPAVAPDGTPVVAAWTGTLFSLDDFEAAYADAEGGVVTDSLTDDSLRARRLDFLERYVDFRLKVRSAREAGYAEDSSYRAEVADYRDQLAGPYFTDRAILDGILRDLYEKQQEEIAVSHVLLRVGPDAPPADTLAALRKILAIRDSIVSQGLGFEAAARRHSEDPSAAQNGGALGYISGGRTVLAFEEAAYGTPVGEVSQPARSQFGYHLVQVTDRRPRTAPIQARHILIRPGATPEDSLARRATMDSVRTAVLGGADFGALAREYSEDPGSAPRGGDLGSFGPGRMVPPFEQAAFALAEPGDVSEVVTTRFGFHLIQLTGRDALPSFDESYDELKSLAQRLPRTALKRRSVGEAERAARGATFDADAIRGAFAGLPADTVQAVAMSGFGEADTTAFAAIGERTFTLAELTTPLRRQRFSVAPGTDPVDALVEFADGFVTEQAVEAAMRDLEDRDPEFARIFQGYTDGVLLFRIAEDSVWTRAADDDAGLRRTFEANADAYRWPERRRILAFRTPADSLLRAVGERLDAGEAPADIFAAHEGDRFALRLDTLRLADSTNTPLDATLELAVGERTDVLPERSRLAVYVLDGIEAPRGKTFDEARAEVISDYQEVLEAEWVARLRARYEARTYPDRVPTHRAPTPEVLDGEVREEGPRTPTSTD